jgi:hypothetical protein
VGPSGDIGFPYELCSLGVLRATSGCSVPPEDSAENQACRTEGHTPREVPGRDARTGDVIYGHARPETRVRSTRLGNCQWDWIYQ